MFFVRTRHVYWHRRTQMRTLVSVTQGTAAKSPRPVPVDILDNPGMRASVQRTTPSPATQSRERDGTPRPQQRLHDLGPGLNAGQPVHEVVTLARYKRIPLDLAEEDARGRGFVVCAEREETNGWLYRRMRAQNERSQVTHAGEHARSDARIRTFTTKVPTGTSPTAAAGYGAPDARASQ